MLKNIDVEKVRTDAQEMFRSGGFYCSEAVVKSIKENIAPEMPDEVVAAASGFPVGVGRSKCICGAVSGGVICMGYFFGRSQPSSPRDEKSINALKLTDELQQSFRDKHKGVLCCSVHTRDMDMSSGEHKAQCISFTGEIAAKVAEIVAREFGMEIIMQEEMK